MTANFIFLALVLSLVMQITEVMAAPTNGDKAGPSSLDTNVWHLLTCSYGGEYYTYFTTFSNLSKSPPWIADRNEPPISVRAAVLIAEKYARDLVPAATDFRPTKVQLNHADFWVEDIWFYDVQITPFMHASVDVLHPVNAGSSVGPLEPMEIVVLMDGTVPNREMAKK